MFPLQQIYSIDLQWKNHEENFRSHKDVVVLIVLCFGVEFWCCLNLMHVFIFLVKFGN